MEELIQPSSKKFKAVFPIYRSFIFCLDILLIYGMTALLNLILHNLFNFENNAIIDFIFISAIFIFIEAKYSTSIFKKLFRIKVVNDSGENIDFLQVIKRFFARILFIGVGLLWIGVIFMTGFFIAWLFNLHKEPLAFIRGRIKFAPYDDFTKTYVIFQKQIIE